MKILSIGCFTHAQMGRQLTEHSWLLVNLGGLISQSIGFSSGWHSHLKKENQEHSFLLPKGCDITFDYGMNRENWVIMLPDNAVQETSNGKVKLFVGSFNGELPALLPMNMTQAEKSREYLKRILHSYHNPNKQSSLLVNLTLCSLLDCIINPELSIEQELPAQALRKRIISDTNFSKTINMHSRECGYSVDHLRRLFENQFGITPQSFRMNYRMHLAKDLLKTYKSTAKAVSDQLGFNTPSHFSLSFKKHFGCSPGEMK